MPADQRHQKFAELSIKSEFSFLTSQLWRFHWIDPDWLTFEVDCWFLMAASSPQSQYSDEVSHPLQNVYPDRNNSSWVIRTLPHPNPSKSLAISRSTAELFLTFEIMTQLPFLDYFFVFNRELSWQSISILDFIIFWNINFPVDIFYIFLSNFPDISFRRLLINCSFWYIHDGKQKLE